MGKKQIKISKKDVQLFLKALGYNRITHKEYEDIASVKCNADIKGFYERHKEAYENPIMTASDVYNLQMNHEIWFDAKVSFLCEISKKLIADSNKKEDYRVLDSGMGLGIDVAFLARKLPYIQFEGYDVQSGMVENALTLQKRLGLDNVSLYKASHSEIQGHTDEKFDMIYNTAALLSKTHNPMDSVDDAVSICSHSKKGGLFVISGIVKGMKTKGFSGELKKQGVCLKYSKQYHKSKGNANSMNVYQVNM